MCRHLFPIHFHGNAVSGHLDADGAGPLTLSDANGHCRVIGPRPAAPILFRTKRLECAGHRQSFSPGWLFTFFTCCYLRGGCHFGIQPLLGGRSQKHTRLLLLLLLLLLSEE